jgi:peptide/nickel transport system ATP-binding protein
VSSPLVDVAGLSVVYGPNDLAVSDLDLSIAAGETVAVVGESGSGKTTVANAILGLLPGTGRVTAGTIRILDQDVTGASQRDLAKIRGSVVGYVPQDPMVGLNPTLRVGAQVAEAVRHRGPTNKPQLNADVVEALEQAGLDNPVLRARQYPHELSGGMRQRVLIAIALAGRPRLLIADEPTSALDVTVQRRILDHLEGLVREAGISLLIITHDLGVAADRADRLLVMQHGRVVEQGDPTTVLTKPRHEYAKHLVAATPGLAPTEIPAAAPAKPLLELRNVTKDFRLPKAPGAARTLRALDDVSLAVPPGQTLGLVGESGSGKTTAIRVALGLETLSAGSVWFDGEDITGRTWRQLRPLRRRFQLVHQNPFASLDPKFSLREAITEPLVAFRVGTAATRKARAVELLDQVRLARTLLDRRPAELSGGQRQRVAIARALALEPDLLLLDEPVSALDVSVQGQILDLLAGLQRDLGLSYLFISHDLAVVAQLAHTVAVMQGGRVVEQGPVHTVFTQPATDYTRELLASIPGRPHSLKQ